MRVLLVNSVAGIKSTGRVCTDLADVLMKLGHEVRIAYGRECIPQKYEEISYKIEGDFSINIHGLESMLFDRHGLSSRKVTERFVKWIDQYNPDLIHLHNIHGYYLNYEILFQYLKRYGKPVVWTLHDCWSFTGHCSHFVLSNCDKWKMGCHNCEQFRTYPKSLIFDCSQRNWKLKKKMFTSIEKLILVTPSEWLAKQVKESFFSKKTVFAIPNGVDLEKFVHKDCSFKKEQGLDNKYMILGVATAWGDSKGLVEFCELNDYLGEQYQVVLVGLTKDQISKLPAHVIGIEKTNTIERLAEIYSAADVFVNAGKAETMGLTTVEAMACGTPVVVSNLTAVPEVVDAKGGVVFEKYTARDIASSIINIVQNRELYKETRTTALKFEKKRQYMKYIELYNSLLQEDKVKEE